ncbi:winged helix DNA-binding domain-containing protein [Actinomarinicola tropica]|uniref:winged helix DNA-binding domain-containing protein n=1 Tax=Actinomarinicola tropica TaxID=2789776 RepID=UPI001899230A|nr:winged helix DNA-binding domain-containing protein [Actinomarinicola tropica]
MHPRGRAEGRKLAANAVGSCPQEQPHSAHGPRHRRPVTVDRALVVSWLHRGTLHLVPAADHHWLHALTAPRQLVHNARRLGEEGVPPADADRAVEVVMSSVRAEGPLTREQLRDRVDAAGIRTAGQAIVHILMAATLRHALVRGPVVDGRHAFVDVESWLGPMPPVDHDAALAELARRYLRGHGPASARDLAAWSGLTLGDARAGLAAIAEETEPWGDDNLVVRRDHRDARPPPPRLLGPFDPLLHGWTDRPRITGPHRGVVTTNGLFRAIALVDGRAVATWRWERGAVDIDPLEPIAPDALVALGADADDVRRFLG